MKPPTPRDLRNAVMLAVLLTVIATLALIDPSCRREPSESRWPPPAAPSR
ncbi:MAG: hypothetical protein NTV51_29305 [Verrucomicrobia bacterium]|nr:hypothetical protein [Verrucomicrobiota bacterium]